MKLQIVITANPHESCVTLWFDPSDMRWSQPSRAWTGNSGKQFVMRRDQFAGRMVAADATRLSLPTHQSMDALRVELSAISVLQLEPVSYLKPLEALGEI